VDEYLPQSQCTRPTHPPHPKKKKSFGLYTILPRNLKYLFIPPENEHTSAKLIVNFYLKNPKTTVSSDDESALRDWNPMCYFYRVSISLLKSHLICLYARNITSA